MPTYSTKDFTGRPRYYSDPIELEQKVAEYFDYCERHQKPPGICGLSLFLGFSDRSSFQRYEKYEGFSHVVKSARLRIESWIEEKTAQKDSYHPGLIWLSKAHYGWREPEAEHVNSFEEVARRLRELQRDAEAATIDLESNPDPDDPDDDADAEMV